jgi:ribonuclease BN (tRNA processing enzyme)
MELTILGSGTVAPSPSRGAPAHWVTADAVRLLLDCGSGALHRAACVDIPWYDVTHVALTHFHADHWTELPLLLFALRWGHEPARSKPLTIIGPTGLHRRLAALGEAFGPWVLDPGYPLELHEIEPGATVDLADSVSLASHPTPHTDESLAYAIAHGGSRLVYTGDTGPSEALADWARPCDLLLCECSLPESRAMDIHLTPVQAGRLAARAAARRLVLVHFYPPVEDPDPAAIAATEFDGPVAQGRDGDRFTIESVGGAACS